MNIFVFSAVLIRIFSNSMSNVFQKKLTNIGKNPLLINFLTYFLLMLFCLFLPSLKEYFFLTSKFYIYSVLGGICGALGNAYLIKALKSGDLSVLGPINSYKSVVSIIFALVLLREVPNVYGLLGIVLIVWGSYFVLTKKGESFSFSIFKRVEIKYRFYALFLTAIEAVLIKKVILFSNVELAFISWCLFGALFSYLFMGKKCKMKEVFVLFKEKSSLNLLMIAFCVGLMQYSTNYVFHNMNVSYALALFQLSTLLSVFLGYKIFKESDVLKKFVGAFIMMIGAIVIVLYN